jgi:recombination directionality factor gp3-like protein
MPITSISPRMPRLGRISLGYKTKSKTGVVHPTKSKTFCFTSDSKERLEHLAAQFGGKVQAALANGGGNEDGRWLLVSEATDLPVMIPAEADELVYSQWLENHSASGLRRRCDSETVHVLRDYNKDTGEVTTTENVPCICKAEGLEGVEACKMVLRLNVVVLEGGLDAPGLGVWTVTSAGYHSNQATLDAITMLRALIGRCSLIPLSLGIADGKAQVTGKNGKATPATFRYYTLNTNTVTMRQGLEAAASRPGSLAGALRAIGALPPPPDEVTGFEPFDGDDPDPDDDGEGVGVQTAEPSGQGDETPTPSAVPTLAQAEANVRAGFGDEVERVEESGPTVGEEGQEAQTATPATSPAPSSSAPNDGEERVKLMLRLEELLEVAFPESRPKARASYMAGALARCGVSALYDATDDHLANMIAELEPAAEARRKASA